jgi:hypothetical protein
MESWHSLGSFSPANLSSPISKFSESQWSENSWNSTAAALITNPEHYLSFVFSIQKAIGVERLNPPTPHIVQGMCVQF